MVSSSKKKKKSIKKKSSVKNKDAADNYTLRNRKLHESGFVQVSQGRSGYVKCCWCGYFKGYNLNKHFRYDTIREHAQVKHKDLLKKLQQQMQCIVDDCDYGSVAEIEDNEILHLAYNIRGKNIFMRSGTKESTKIQEFTISKDFMSLLKRFGFKETVGRTPFENDVDGENGERVVHVKNTERFEKIVKSVAIGGSYKQIEGMWAVHNNTLTEKELSCAVPKIGIIALIQIKDILDTVEGFSLGIDGASLNFGGLEYEKFMGLRGSIFVKGQNHSFYVGHLPISRRELEGMEEMEEMEELEELEDETVAKTGISATEKVQMAVIRILDVICEEWREKLVGT